MTNTKKKSFSYKEPKKRCREGQGLTSGYLLQMKGLGHCFEVEFDVHFELWQHRPSMGETDLRCQPLPLDQLFLYLSMALLCLSLRREKCDM